MPSHILYWGKCALIWSIWISQLGLTSTHLPNCRNRSKKQASLHAITLLVKKIKKRPFPQTEKQANKHHLFLKGLKWGNCYQRNTTDISHGCTNSFPFSCESEQSCQQPPALLYHEGHSGASCSEPQTGHFNSYSDFRADTNCRIAQLVIVNRVITGKSEQKGGGGEGDLPWVLLRSSEQIFLKAANWKQPHRKVFAGHSEKWCFWHSESGTSLDFLGQKLTRNNCMHAMST